MKHHTRVRLAPLLVLPTTLAAIIVLAASAAAASPMSNGNAAYKAGNYQLAVQDYQQAAAKDKGVDQARAYYKEGLAYRRLREFPQAVQALKQANQIDPTDSFASSPSKFQQMLREAQSSYVGPINPVGTARIARNVGGAAVIAPTTSSHGSGADFLWIVLILVIVVVLALIISANRRKRAQLVAQRGPVENLKQNVLANIEYIDGYADVLPKNNSDSDQVKAFRQAAAAKFEQAEKIMDRATEPSDLYRAQSLLDRASADTDQARRYLDRATGGTGSIPGDDAVRPVPLPTNQDQTQSVPADQRGVSFFSSRPASVSQLVPVTITVDGQPRQVMATPDEAAQIQQGQTPPVRSFNIGGQNVPWYEYQQYDPYRDYWSYQNNGWRGIAGGAVAGFVGAELINSLFNRPRYDGWYSPYGYAPGWDSWGGWNSYDQAYAAGEQAERAQGLAFNDPYNQPMGATGYDTQDYGASGQNIGDQS